MRFVGRWTTVIALHLSVFIPRPSAALANCSLGASFDGLYSSPTTLFDGTADCDDARSGSASWSDPFGSHAASASGVVTAGGIRVGSHVNFVHTSPIVDSSWSAISENASSQITDIVIADTTGSGSTSVSTSMNLDLEFDIGISGPCHWHGGPSDGQLVYLLASVRLSSGSTQLLVAGDQIQWVSAQSPPGSGNCIGYDSNGIHAFLPNLPGGPNTAAFNGVLTTPSVELPIGTPLTAVLMVQTRVGTSIFDASAAASANVVRFAFPTSGPILNLPPGFTVNSAEGQVVDNEWVGDLPSIPSVPSISPHGLAVAAALVLIGAGQILYARQATRGSCSPGQP
jgi:hypothetical protein